MSRFEIEGSTDMEFDSKLASEKSERLRRFQLAWLEDTGLLSINRPIEEAEKTNFGFPKRYNSTLVRSLVVEGRDIVHVMIWDSQRIDLQKLDGDVLTAEERVERLAELKAKNYEVIWSHHATTVMRRDQEAHISKIFSNK